MTLFKNLLVTGGAGFIGSTFVAQAVARGQKVIVLDALTYAGSEANLRWIDSANWQLVVGDITDQTLVAKLLVEHEIDALVNFAAESHVDNSISGPNSFINTNIHGTFSLLEAARNYAPSKMHFRFLQISTDEVYGSLGAAGKFSESSKYQPNSPYSASKAAADHLVRAWCETYGLYTITTHCTNNYGPRQHPEKLIPRMIACALAGDDLPVYGDGKNIRDWIHVEDHAKGVWLALSKGESGGVYDFGGDAEVENIALVTDVCAILDGLRPKNSGSYAEQISFVTDRLGHDRRYAIDDSKSQNKLGFSRDYTFQKGLKKTIEWYLANEAWYAQMIGKKAA